MLLLINQKLHFDDLRVHTIKCDLWERRDKCYLNGMRVTGLT